MVIGNRFFLYNRFLFIIIGDILFILTEKLNE